MAAAGYGAWAAAWKTLPLIMRAQFLGQPKASQDLSAPLADLFRDIFGNPFRPVAFDISWRTPAVLALVQGLYDERELPSGQLDVGRLAILADALEDAGSTEAAILNHCREPGVHVRGCWVVDLSTRTRFTYNSV
jgi:hypothetical protein